MTEPEKQSWNMKLKMNCIAVLRGLWNGTLTNYDCQFVSHIRSKLVHDRNGTWSNYKITKKRRVFRPTPTISVFGRYSQLETKFVEGTTALRNTATTLNYGLNLKMLCVLKHTLISTVQLYSLSQSIRLSRHILS